MSQHTTRTSSLTVPAGRSFGLSVWSALILAGLVLLSRRLAGALPTPLPPLTLGIVATAVTALGLLAFRCVCPGLPIDSPRRRWALGLSCLAVILPVASVSPIPLIVTTSGAIILLLSLGCALSWFLDQGQDNATAQASNQASSITGSQVSLETQHMSLTSESTPQAPVPISATSDSLNDEQEFDDTTDNVVQQLTRRDAEGVDVFEGLLRVDFAAGQKLAIIHVPFWPAFDNRPQIACEGTDCRVKVAAIQAYGARIEVKRSDATDAVQIWVEMCARDDHQDRAAA